MKTEEREILTKWADYMADYRARRGGIVLRNEMIDLLWLISEEYNLINRVPEYDRELRLASEEVARLRTELAKAEVAKANAERAENGIKQEALGYLKGHMKLVDWLCDNGFGNSCADSADTVLKVLELSLEKLDLQENYIQASVSAGQQFAQDYNRDMRKLDSQVEGLKKCL